MYNLKMGTMSAYFVVSGFKLETKFPFISIGTKKKKSGKAISGIYSHGMDKYSFEKGKRENDLLLLGVKCTVLWP